MCSIDSYSISCYNESRWGSFVLTGFFVYHTFPWLFVISYTLEYWLSH